MSSFEVEKPVMPVSLKLFQSWVDFMFLGQYYELNPDTETMTETAILPTCAHMTVTDWVNSRWRTSESWMNCQQTELRTIVWSDTIGIWLVPLHLRSMLQQCREPRSESKQFGHSIYFVWS